MDFAAPQTPGDVCRWTASRLEYDAKDHRRQAAEHLALAEELERQARSIESDARSFDRYQPVPDETPTEATS